MKHDPETIELLDEIEARIGVRLDSIGVPPHVDWLRSLAAKLDQREQRTDAASASGWQERMAANNARANARITAARTQSAAAKAKATKR